MEIFALRCPWYVAGPLLGLLITALLWATNKPLGALGGYCDTVEWLQARARDVGVFCKATPLHSIETIRAWRCQSKALRASAR